MARSNGGCDRGFPRPQGTPQRLRRHPYNGFWDAWECFRTEKEGDACSPKTIEYYHYQVVPFLEWLGREHPEVLDFPQLTADHLRSYRAWLARRRKRYGGRLDPTSLLTSHKAIRSVLKWIKDNNRQVQMDPAVLEFRRPRQPHNQALLFDIGEVRRILKSCELLPRTWSGCWSELDSGSRNFAGSA